MPSFGGQQIKRPGAYSTVDTSGMTPITLGAFNVLAYVGQLDASAKIQSHKAVFFNDPKVAEKVIKKGAVLDNMNVAWSHGADLIAVVRADTSTQATGALKDGATTPADAITLTAIDYGTDGNDITFHIASGAINVTDGVTAESFTIGTKTNDEIVTEINNDSVLVTATKVTDTTPVNPTTATNMAGGSGGATPTDANWQSAVDALEAEFVDAIIPVTTSTAIQTKVDTHITNMSSVTNRKERRAFYGHASGLTVASVKALPANFSNGRTTIASPAVKVYDANGKVVTKNSILLASSYAGTWAGKNPQDPITYDYVKFAGLETRYSNGEIAELLGAGVAVTEFVNGKGYRIVQGITTSSSKDLTEKELSVATLKDRMSKVLRETLEEKHVGKAGVKGIEVTIYNDVISILESFIRNGWITEYVKDTVKVTKDATSFVVDWEGKPTLPINNFFITSHFTL